MDKPLIDALAERVQRLERKNRHWRWAMAATVVGVVAGASFGTFGSKAMMAQQSQPEAPYRGLNSSQYRQPDAEPPYRMLRVGGRYVNWHHISYVDVEPAAQAQGQQLIVHFAGGDQAPLPLRVGGEEASALRMFLNAVSFKMTYLPGEPPFESLPPPPPAGPSPPAGTRVKPAPAK
jgi:hypothetical protein